MYISVLVCIMLMYAYATSSWDLVYLTALIQAGHIILKFYDAVQSGHRVAGGRPCTSDADRDCDDPNWGYIDSSGKSAAAPW